MNEPLEQFHITSIKHRKLSVRELWSYRELLRRMSHRQYRLRAGKSFLNLIWPFIRPAVMTLALIYLRQMSGANFGVDLPYPLYVFSGLCFWFFFAELTINLAGSLSSNASLLQKVYFPPIVPPLAIMISRLPELLLILLAVGGLQIYFGVGLSEFWWALIPALLTLFALAAGIGLLFAGLSLVYSDVTRILEVILYLGLFLSPVFFAIEIYPETVRGFFAMNPMGGVLSAIRGSLFTGIGIDWSSWGYALISAAALLLAGISVFVRAEHLVRENG
ncbi:MAG: ABC transporter permease [Pseudomonadota bacterium]